MNRFQFLDSCPFLLRCDDLFSKFRAEGNKKNKSKSRGKADAEEDREMLPQEEEEDLGVKVLDRAPQINQKNPFQYSFEFDFDSPDFPDSQKNSNAVIQLFEGYACFQINLAKKILGRGASAEILSDNSNFLFFGIDEKLEDSAQMVRKEMLERIKEGEEKENEE